jgi:ubiquinone/menaquinone biosynthesis C-methylase UbiE
MSCDDIQFEDERFDLIVGMDSLKTSDITATVNHLHRILKPGGIALFKDQIITPLDKADNTETAITESDLQLLEDTFDDVQVRRFTILSRLDHLIPRSSQSTRATLEKLDRKLLDLCPPMAKLGATAVITCARHAKTIGDDIQFAA